MHPCYLSRQCPRTGVEEKFGIAGARPEVEDGNAIVRLAEGRPAACHPPEQCGSDLGPASTGPAQTGRHAEHQSHTAQACMKHC